MECTVLLVTDSNHLGSCLGVVNNVHDMGGTIAYYVNGNSLVSSERTSYDLWRIKP